MIAVGWSHSAMLKKVRPMEQWERFTPSSWVLTSALSTLTCSFLQIGGCGIYDIRPKICQLFGAVDHPMMQCPHGCGPKRLMTERQSRAYLAEATP